MLFKSTDFWENSSLALKIANDKWLTYDMLDRLRLPKVDTHYVNISTYVKYIQDTDFTFPLVIKPLDDGHGNGVETQIESKDELIAKLTRSFEKYSDMIIQKQVYWDEFRFIVLRWKTISVLNRIPASIEWDWLHTIEELITLENNSPERWDWYSWSKSKIVIDNELKSFISKNWLALDCIPRNWETIQVRWNSNYWTGWSIKNCTLIAHRELKEIAEKLARELNMWIVWVDIMCEDITSPVKNQEVTILEINATTWLIWNEEVVWQNLANIILKELFKLS